MVKLRVLRCGEGYFVAEPATKFWGLRNEVTSKSNAKKSITMVCLGVFPTKITSPSAYDTINYFIDLPFADFLGAPQRSFGA